MEKRLKIIQFIPELGIAGAEKMVQDLSIKIAESGHEVIIVSLYTFKSSITEYLEEKKIPIIYLNKKKGLDFRIFSQIRKILKTKKPDIIHTHRYLLTYVYLSSMFLKIKRIHTIHNIAIHESKKIYRIMNWVLFKLNLVTPVAISNKIEESIRNTYRLKHKIIPIIPNGINLSRCIPKQFYTFTDNIEIIHVGRFAPAKNHDSLIQAIYLLHETYPNIHLSCYGHGELFESISRKIVELGISPNVTLHGIKPDVYTYLNKSDIFILPSLWEGAPITLIEAMCTALPIIVTNVGGISDYITNNLTGVFVESTPQSIASAIHRLIVDLNLRTSLGAHAYNESMNFSVENMARKYISLYKGEIDE